MTRIPFTPLTPELDQAIEQQMDAIATCDAIDELEAVEENIARVEDHLDARMDKLRDIRKNLTRRQRTMLSEVRDRLVGSNSAAEMSRHAYIEHLSINGGQVTINQAGQAS